MCEEFDAYGALPHLVDKYQRLDYEMACALRAAANSVRRADFGYQRSPELVRAGRTVTMWRFIIQSITAGWEYTDRIHSLAQLFHLTESEYVGVSLAYANAQLANARRIQREVMRNDSNKRQHWLEEIADAIALDNPGSDKEAILRQMISRSRAIATHRKLSNIYEPNDGAIKLTKIPVTLGIMILALMNFTNLMMEFSTPIHLLADLPPMTAESLRSTLKSKSLQITSTVASKQLS